MARLTTNGFETQMQPTTTAANDPEGQGWIRNGAPVITTTNPRTYNGVGGAAALNCASAATQRYMSYTFTGATNRGYYLRMGVRWSAVPGAAAMCMGVFSLGTIASVTLNTSGNIEVSDRLSSLATITGLSTATWYTFELFFNVPPGGGANAIVVFLIDGVQRFATTTADLSTGAPNSVGLGNMSPNTTTTFAIDDLALNDNTGSNQTSWCGQGTVKFLVPTSQNSNTGWTKPGGATTNLHTSVDNLPPVGIADSTSAGDAEKMIRDPTNNNTDNWVGLCPSWSSAGISAQDWQVLTYGIARGGNSTTTSRNLAVSIPFVSSEATQGTGATAAATDPTGWVTATTANVYQEAQNALDVTGTLAIKVRKGTASANTMLYDLAGIMVETRTAWTGAGSIAGAGSVAASGTRTTFGAAATTGAGSVAATGTRSAVASASVSGAGSIGATGTRKAVASASVAGAGSISATGTRSAIAAATVTGNGSISASGTRTTIASAAVTGNGSINASGYRAGIASAAISGSGTISATGMRATAGVASISGAGSVSASGLALSAVGASIVGTGSVSATGQRTTFGNAALAGAGALAVSASHLTQFGAGAVSGNGSVQGSGYLILTSSVDIAGAGSITAQGGILSVGVGVIAGAGSISATGRAISRWGYETEDRWPEDTEDRWAESSDDRWEQT